MQSAREGFSAVAAVTNDTSVFDTVYEPCSFTRMGSRQCHCWWQSPPFWPWDSASPDEQWSSPHGFCAWGQCMYIMHQLFNFCTLSSSPSRRRMQNSFCHTLRNVCTTIPTHSNKQIQTQTQTQHTDTHTHTCIYMRIHTHTNTRRHTHMHTHTRVHTCMHTRTHTYAHVFTYAHTHIHTCFHIRTHTYIHIFIHIRTHTHPLTMDSAQQRSLADAHHEHHAHRRTASVVVVGPRTTLGGSPDPSAASLSRYVRVYLGDECC